MPKIWLSKARHFPLLLRLDQKGKPSGSSFVFLIIKNLEPTVEENIIVDAIAVSFADVCLWYYSSVSEPTMNSYD